jgi:hypothetical protein
MVRVNVSLSTPRRKIARIIRLEKKTPSNQPGNMTTAVKLWENAG